MLGKHGNVETAFTAIAVFVALFLVSREKLLTGVEDRACIPIAIIFIKIVVWPVVGDDKQKS